MCSTQGNQIQWGDCQTWWSNLYRTTDIAKERKERTKWVHIGRDWKGCEFENFTSQTKNCFVTSSLTWLSRDARTPKICNFHKETVLPRFVDFVMKRPDYQFEPEQLRKSQNWRVNNQRKRYICIDTGHLSKPREGQRWYTPLNLVMLKVKSWINEIDSNETVLLVKLPLVVFKRVITIARFPDRRLAWCDIGSGKNIVLQRARKWVRIECEWGCCV